MYCSGLSIPITKVENISYQNNSISVIESVAFSYKLTVGQSRIDKRSSYKQKCVVGILVGPSQV